MPEPLRLPADLVIGVATAAYQIEGAVDEDGRGPSIWDTFSHTPGRTWDGDTGDVACDHYHRVDADLDLMASLGVDAYRFSVAWPRIQPQGRGTANPAGLAFYDRLVDGLLERGIEPYATLYHWDLPQALQDAGGWPHRDTAGRFADYAAIVGDALGDRVRHWMTLNEPWVSAHLGHHAGIHAPGTREPRAAVAAAHHLLLGHGLGAEALRSVTDGDVGIVLNLQPIRAHSDRDEDRDAARLADGVHNRWWLDALVHGHYPDDVLAAFGRAADLEFVRDGDAATIAQPLDLLGINYYTTTTVRARGGPSDEGESPPGVGLDQVVAVPQRGEHTAMGWLVDPDALTALLLRVDDEYGLPLFITENGAAFDDEVVDGRVDDPRRVGYLDAHLRAALAARERGADLRGYFVWSFLDNFEWAEGYRMRFGIVHVDYDTQVRTPKTSAHWLADRLRERGGLEARA